MKIVLGFIVGLLWGAAASGIISIIGKRCAAKNTPEAVTAYARASGLIGLAAVLIVFLVRNLLPLNNLAMIMGTAIALSSLSIIFALKISSRKK